MNSTNSTDAIKAKLTENLIIQALSAILPEELLRDTLDEQGRRVLTDFVVACLLIGLIFLPSLCFKSQYDKEIEEMNERGVDFTDINLSKEDIKDLKIV